jgi:hypothetical protein
MGVQNSNNVNITGGSITGVQYNAADITSGVLALARGGTGNSLAIGGPGSLFLSNGSVMYFDTGVNISQLNASNLVAGTVPAARLSNVGFLNATQNWTGTNSFLGIFAVAEMVNINGGNPGFLLQGTTGGVNEHRILFFNYLGNMIVQLQDDAGNYRVNPLSITTLGQIQGPDFSGASNLDGAKIALGIINPARMGSGIANSTTVLYGDNVWRSPGGGGGSGIPSGLIAMFDTNCPADWTRVSSMDNRFPIGSTAFGGVGGSGSHSHSVGLNTGGGGAHGHSFSGTATVDGTVDANTQKVQLQYGTGSAIDVAYYAHNHHARLSGDFSGNTSNVGDHTHQVNGQTSDVAHYPPYIGVVFCRKN